MGSVAQLPPFNSQPLGFVGKLLFKNNELGGNIAILGL